MIELKANCETDSIGTLNARELSEIAGFIAIKNNWGNWQYTLTRLIETAKEKPDMRVYKYVEDATSKDY